MLDVKPAAFKRRRAGQVVAAALTGPESGPQVVVQFKIPDQVEEAAYEARARQEHQIITRSPEVMASFGLEEKTITAEQAEGLRDMIFLVCAAEDLWQDWNVILEPDVSVTKMDRRAISILLSDRFMRIAWNAHLSNVVALERSEGNVFAASLNGNSEEAANTARDATSETPHALGGWLDDPESSAPA